ncbi:MAG: SbcC/MukB-like Walker B domain-containing protein, partial [Candidatus Thermoplasmatota archaeon]|nr:SbcC/MukB-like Walker B domain-containing protein [Candidatus Thermoplasmatota archaeon]
SRGLDPLEDRIKPLDQEIITLTSILEERTRRLDHLKTDENLSGLTREEIEKSNIRIRDLRTSITRIRDDFNELEKELSAVSEGVRSGKESLLKMIDKKEMIEKKLISDLLKINVPSLKDIEDLRAALLNRKTEDGLQEIFQQHKDEIVRNEALLGKLKVQREELGRELEITEEEHLKQYQEEETTRKNEWKEAGEERANIEKDLKWSLDQIKNIESIREGIEDLEKELKIVGKLSSQVRGLDNPRMSLERFFLAQRFEEVLISSNHRLKILSGGRFLLKRADEMEMGGRSKVGLDLDVYDNYTGLDRPANTLSGGQMFLSSLALALGLADVVQSRSGGIHMDALFIDEGFGSLDEETLQTALKVLSELREGRMVGVISHVGELKRQIKTGFEVVPSTSGSRIRTIG